MLMSHQRAAIEAEAVASIMASVERDGPYKAEIVPDCSPSWHLLRAQPGHDAVAAAHLVGRGFGVYMPMFRYQRSYLGRRIVRERPLLPGYLLLFVWDEERHRRRVHACPGVASIVYINETPVRVPDAVVDRLQIIEAQTDETLGFAKTPRSKRRRRTPEDWNATITISTKAFDAAMRTVDARVRLGALEKALGLA